MSAEPTLASVAAQLARIEEKLASLTTLVAAGTVAQQDDLLGKIKELLAASKAASKDKKKDATTGDAKETEQADEIKKATHPNYPELPQQSWQAKKTAKTPHEQIERFVVSMLAKYPANIRPVIGEGYLTEAAARAKDALDKATTPQQKAAVTVGALWAYLTEVNKMAEVETALLKFWETERAMLAGKQLGQVTSETAPAAEAEAKPSTTA